MTENTRNSGKLSKIELIDRVFILGFFLAEVIILLIFAVFPDRDKPIYTFRQISQFVHIYVSISIILIIVLHIVTWRWLKRISEGKLERIWPKTHLALLLIIMNGIMILILIAVISSLLLGKDAPLGSISIMLMAIITNYIGLSRMIIESAKKT